MNILLMLAILYNLLVLCYFTLLNSMYLFLNLVAFFRLRNYFREMQVVDLGRRFLSSFYKPLTIIVPAFNEEQTIVESVYSLLQLQYPEFEVIVVDDGSTDTTFNQLQEAFDLYEINRSFDQALPCKTIKGLYASVDHPNLVIVNKANGGKADALNAGINVANFPLFCNIDADSILDADSLLKMTRPFLENRHTVAVGGIIRVSNDCLVKAGKVVEVNIPRSSLARFQVVEYLRAFLFGRVGWGSLNNLLIISGAFGIFKRQAIVECGGYRTDTVGEDMELVVRLHRLNRIQKKRYEIQFTPDPVCWTQVPERLSGLSRQRRRWQRGLAESLHFNREMFLNPRFGTVGLLGFPFFVFFEKWGPVIELTGYLVFLLSAFLGILNVPFMLLFLTMAILLGILLSTSSIVLEELSFRRYRRLKDLLVLFCYAILENFGYRQLHSWWRLRGLWDFYRRKQGWGQADRRSFVMQNAGSKSAKGTNPGAQSRELE